METTENSYERFVTPALVREIFESSILDSTAERWVISVCGKIVAIQGKIFYNSRDQAVKAFYNSFSWKVRRKFGRLSHPEDINTRWWSDPNRGQYWKDFKSALTKNYGFVITRV